MRSLSFLAVLLLSSQAFAQGSFLPRSMDRAGTWEVGFTVFDQDSEFVEGREGSNADFSSDTGFGFTFGYNFDNHFYLGGDFLWAEPRYTATIVDENLNPAVISHKATFFTSQLRGTYNVLEGPLTPYIDGGLGFTYVDSNVVDGPGGNVCWWDPFWGWVCRPVYSTYDDTRFSWSVGAGVRWDATPGFTLRGGYTLNTVDLSSGVEDAEFGILRLDLLWRY